MRENKIKVTTVCALFALQFFLAAIACAIEDKNSLQTCLDMQGKVPSDKVLECYNQVAQEQLAKSETKKKYRSLIAERGIGLAEEWTPSDEPLQIYKQNYFLFYSHSSQPNNTPTSPNPKDQVPFSYPLDNKEMKFQISIKGHLLGGNRHTLWFGYTQLSFWQFYDHTHSSPFRESNYAPELIYSYRPGNLLPGLGVTTSFLNAGFLHQSNGQALPMHRGWNRFYIQAGLEHDFGDSGRLALLPRWWKRIVEGTLTNDDNPDITQYLGHGDIEARYYYGHGVFSAVAMIHSLQLDLAMPMPQLLGVQIQNINLHLQYFDGYGESLIDYNQSHHTFGLGISLPFE